MQKVWYSPLQARDLEAKVKGDQQIQTAVVAEFSHPETLFSFLGLYSLGKFHLVFYGFDTVCLQSTYIEVKL